jgi:hypothetical protein
MSVTYFVALPFVRTGEGIAPGQAQEMPNEVAAIRRAEAMSREPEHAGALAEHRIGSNECFDRGQDRFRYCNMRCWPVSEKGLSVT